jgi:hypothetical protein
MATLRDPSGFSTPTIPDPAGDASRAHFGLPDDANAEMAASEDAIDRLRGEENPFALFPRFTGDCECRGCGRFTSGSTVAGVDVQLCDTCLTEFVFNSIDVEVIRDVAQFMYPEWQMEVRD